ncbi:MAG: ATP-binding protein [Spirochaetaceae bacterium]
MEIKKELNLSEGERNIVEMHSALNILNILTYELLAFSELTGSREQILPSLNSVQEIASTLSDRKKTMGHFSKIGEKKQHIIENLESVVRESSADSAQLKSAKDNMLSLLNVLEIRAAEIISRESSYSAWVRHDTEKLKERFLEVFRAIEKNSKGRYFIVFDPAEHNEKSYLVKLLIEGERDNTIYMPPEIQDVFRDLIANARKYTEPGGKIDAELRVDGKMLTLTVEDNGKGIPQDQIESIVDYGVRAYNVAEKRSYGGGYGLTKAYYTARRFRGRMWIDSRENEGTKITIKIPVPENDV